MQLAFLGFVANLGDRNVRIATDPEEATKGSLQLITPPPAATGGKIKRGFGFRSRKRGISYAPIQKGPATTGNKGGSNRLFTA